MIARRAMATVLLLVLAVSAPVVARVVSPDVATQLSLSPIVSPQKAEFTALTTTPSEILATTGGLATGGNDATYSGWVRASIENRGSVEVCVSWTGATSDACSTNGKDCDGDDDDGTSIAAGERYSPVYNAANMGRLCAAAASGTPSVKVEYELP